LSETLAVQRKVLPPRHPTLAGTLGGLGLALLRSGRPANAEPLLREALEIRRGAPASGHWRIDWAESLLGECLAAQKRFIEAEPLLLGSAERLLVHAGAMPIRRHRAVERIIALYESSGRPAEAAVWRAKRMDIDFPADAFSRTSAP
jgi:hypothetical protein